MKAAATSSVRTVIVTSIRDGARAGAVLHDDFRYSLGRAILQDTAFIVEAGSYVRGRDVA